MLVARWLQFAKANSSVGRIGAEGRNPHARFSANASCGMLPSCRIIVARFVPGRMLVSNGNLLETSETLLVVDTNRGLRDAGFHDGRENLMRVFNRAFVVLSRHCIRSGNSPARELRFLRAGG